MLLRTAEDHLVSEPPMPGSPTITVCFGGGEGESPDIGVLKIVVPPGATMPSHQHHGSDVVLIPLTGSIRLSSAGESVEVRVGDTVLVDRDESVSLSNPGDAVAELIVAAGPADFVAGIRAWSLISAAPA